MTDELGADWFVEHGAIDVFRHPDGRVEIYAPNEGQWFYLDELERVRSHREPVTADPEMN